MSLVIGRFQFISCQSDQSVKSPFVGFDFVVEKSFVRRCYLLTSVKRRLFTKLNRADVSLFCCDTSLIQGQSIFKNENIYLKENLLLKLLKLFKFASSRNLPLKDALIKMPLAKLSFLHMIFLERN